MLPQDYLNELRSHAHVARRQKDRLVEIDARALLELLRELEARRPAGRVRRAWKKSSRVSASAV
jgi:hypothetical protein